MHGIAHGKRIVLSVTHSLRHLALYDSVVVCTRPTRVPRAGDYLYHYSTWSIREELFPRLGRAQSGRVASVLAKSIAALTMRRSRWIRWRGRRAALEEVSDKPAPRQRGAPPVSAAAVRRRRRQSRQSRIACRIRLQGSECRRRRISQSPRRPRKSTTSSIPAFLRRSRSLA